MMRLEDNTEASKLYLNCFACAFETNNKLLLKRHAINHFDDLLDCTECSFKTNRRNVLNAHASKHLRTMQISECSNCGYESFSLNKLKIHKCRVKRRYSRMYKCFVCKRVSFSRLNLRLHLKCHNKNVIKIIKYQRFTQPRGASFTQPRGAAFTQPRGASFTQPRGASFTQPRDASFTQPRGASEVHERFVSKSLEIDADENRLTCPLCDYKCFQKSELKNHVLSHLKMEFKCYKCSFETHSQIIFNRHLLTHGERYHFDNDYCIDSDTDHVQSESKLFKCSQCDFETKEEEKLKLHLINHIKFFYCSKCNFLTHLYRKLQDHYKAGQCDQEQFPNDSETLVINENNKSIIDHQLLRCCDCSFKTFRPEELKIHLLTVHSETKSIPCSVCKFETRDKEEMRLHVLKHYESKKMKCPQCSLEVSSKRYLAHLKTHSNIRVHNCSLCSYGTNKLYHLKRHTWTVHSNTRRFKCSKCDFECRERKDLRKHVLTHEKVVLRCPECGLETNIRYYKKHVKTHSTIKLHKCNLCSYESFKEYYLNRHILEVHSNTQVFRCSHCSFETRNKEELRTHSQSEHKKTKFIKCTVCFADVNAQYYKKHVITHSDVRLHKCPLCSYQTNNSTQMKRHLQRVHSSVKFLYCSNCSYQTAERNDLRSHVIVKHEDEVLKCPECNFKGDAEAFNKHIMIHSDRNYLKCSNCTYKCKSSSDLKSHILLIHPDKKWLKCRMCFFETLEKEKLDIHILTHAESTVFKCPECPYETRKRYHMNRHLVVHSNIKSIHCPHCDFKAKCKEYLQSHLLTHSVPKHKCPHCEYRTNRKTQIKKHLLSHLVS